jgi:glutamate 5-kinase
MINKKYKTILIKIGTSVITKKDGTINHIQIKNIVEQISQLKQRGHKIILVSSGAVGAGRSLINLKEKTNPVEIRQVLASLGQVKLINQYSKYFLNHEILCSQILVTREDFRDRSHYTNMKNCLSALLKNNIIPIVNENDVVSVTELMFTDNDELSGLLSSMMHVDAQIILSHVDGLLDNEEVISTINPTDSNFTKFIKKEKSEFGRGGMLTKCQIAHKLAMMGISVFIANGLKKNIILDLINEKKVGTKFLPQKKLSSQKRWMAHAEGFEKAIITVNDGCKKVLKANDKIASLLPIGITKIEGQFKKGDILKIEDEKNNHIGLGMAQYGYDKAKKCIGKKGERALIHYDFLYLKK